MELSDVPLFRGLTADEAEAAVAALRMRRRAFAKGEILLEAGRTSVQIGNPLFLSGKPFLQIPLQQFLPVLTLILPVQFIVIRLNGCGQNCRQLHHPLSSTRTG